MKVEAESKVVRDVGFKICTQAQLYIARTMACTAGRKVWRPADGCFQGCERSDWFLCFEIWTQVLKRQGSEGAMEQ